MSFIFLLFYLLVRYHHIVRPSYFLVLFLSLYFSYSLVYHLSHSISVLLLRIFFFPFFFLTYLLFPPFSQFLLEEINTFLSRVYLFYIFPQHSFSCYFPHTTHILHFSLHMSVYPDPTSTLYILFGFFLAPQYQTHQHHSNFEMLHICFTANIAFFIVFIA